MEHEERPRLPPGNQWRERWPAGDATSAPAASWPFRIWGRVRRDVEWTREQFLALPRRDTVADAHSHEGWSLTDQRWHGVATRELLGRVKLRGDAAFVLIHGSDEYVACLSLYRFAAAGALIALSLNGEPLPPERGAPLRLFVPGLLLWKSVKWVRGVEFLSKRWPDHGELSGLAPHADPWAIGPDQP